MSDLSFADRIRSPECEVLVDAPMSRQTTFRAGGNADIIAFPKTKDALKQILDAAKEAALPCFVMGNGSNLLVRDTGLSGVVIKMTSYETEPQVNGTTIRSGAGTPLSRLCTAAYEHSLTGLEFAYGIPGTVGGAVYMNAGAYGGEMKDVLSAVTHLTPDGEEEIFDTSRLALGYRKSFYSANPGYIISSATFTLQKGAPEAIRARMDELLARRKEKQPLEFPSAGSTFKRPEGHFAGALIEQCGLKGYTIGGAQVSEKHAGFLINRYDGPAQDILDLIAYVTDTVQKQTGVTLEPEVKIIP